MGNLALALAAVMLVLRISLNPLTCVFWLALALRWKHDDGRRLVYSFDYVTEPAMLVLVVFCSAFSRGSAWFNRPLLVGLLGAAAVVGSYLLAFLVLWIGGKYIKAREDGLGG